MSTSTPSSTPSAATALAAMHRAQASGDWALSGGSWMVAAH
ncbi:hypothetical protein [Streptomyces griseolus]|nr:hypothetical protein [Streptomyces griseolus]